MISTRSWELTFADCETGRLSAARNSRAARRSTGPILARSSEDNAIRLSRSLADSRQRSVSNRQSSLRAILRPLAPVGPRAVRPQTLQSRYPWKSCPLARARLHRRRWLTDPRDDFPRPLKVARRCNSSGMQLPGDCSIAVAIRRPPPSARKRAAPPALAKRPAFRPRKRGGVRQRRFYGAGCAVRCRSG